MPGHSDDACIHFMANTECPRTDLACSVFVCSDAARRVATTQGDCSKLQDSNAAPSSLLDVVLQPKTVEKETQKIGEVSASPSSISINTKMSEEKF